MSGKAARTRYRVIREGPKLRLRLHSRLCPADEAPLSPRSMQISNFIRPLSVGLAVLVVSLLTSCGDDSEASETREVVIYCALDQVHSEPLIRKFEERTGIKVRAEYDIEAHKTVGLVRRIREEQNRPRCDVFWNNEIAHTVALANEGLLMSYDSPNAADIPETYRDPQRRWTGLAARARVLILNTELMGDREAPDSMWDLVDESWKGEVGMARPLTGTTLTHVAALYDLLGEERTREYLQNIKDNEVSLTSGNATLMRQVREGRMAWGWTDTDDYWVAKSDGFPVDVVFPDSGSDGIGTLFIPNTVCILANAPHPDAAKELVDFILSVEVEEHLAKSRSAQIPLHKSLSKMPHPFDLEQIKPMEVDYQKIGSEINARHDELKELFLD